MTIIGLDPAIRPYGFGKCEIHTDLKVIDFMIFPKFKDFTDWFFHLTTCKLNNSTVIGIENSQEQKNQYWTNVKGASKNQGASFSILNYFQSFKYKVISISPKEKGITLPINIIQQIINKDFAGFKINGISDKSDKMAAFQVANLVYKKLKIESYEKRI